MNVELLEKIAKKMERLRHKSHFDMRVYMKQTNCGTVACIAGYACLLSQYRPDPDRDDRAVKNGEIYSAEMVARSLLNLTKDEAARLFVASYWPERFRRNARSKLYASPRVFNNPKVATARIRHFIQSDGKE